MCSSIKYHLRSSSYTVCNIKTELKSIKDTEGQNLSLWLNTSSLLVTLLTFSRWCCVISDERRRTLRTRVLYHTAILCNCCY